MPHPAQRLVLVACLLAACSSGSGGPHSLPSPTSAAPSPTPISAATRAATPTSVPVAAGSVVLLSASFAPTVTFRSPSGNLACTFPGAICRAKAHTWTSHAPDAQTDCAPARQFAGVQLEADGVVERDDCYDQAEGATTVLAYGHGLELDGERCVSEERGITCVRRADGKGFSISRTRLSLTPWDGPLLHVAASRLDGGRTVRFPGGVGLTFHVGDYFADCLLNDARASCVVRSSAPAPPGDPSCEGDHALTAEVAGATRGRLYVDCRSDANGGEQPLRAGESVQVADLRCTAETATRMRCAHLTGTKHGFVVDARSFRGF